jgi:hypothetical protein
LCGAEVSSASCAGVKARCHSSSSPSRSVQLGYLLQLSGKVDAGSSIVCSSTSGQIEQMSGDSAEGGRQPCGANAAQARTQHVDAAAEVTRLISSSRSPAGRRAADVAERCRRDAAQRGCVVAVARAGRISSRTCHHFDRSAEDKATRETRGRWKDAAFSHCTLSEQHPYAQWRSSTTRTRRRKEQKEETE